jgi:hypothetical protein
LLEEVRPVIEQQTAQNTRIVVASELTPRRLKRWVVGRASGGR